MNTEIWDALAKTDPKHTKPFNRAGGFKGTAIKPIWIVKRLTDHFGACGVGWGINEPSFQVVPCDGETLVFCTVSCWHGTRENVLFGVGGDKAQAKRKDGSFCDDEAFKKAFTDAVGNAFKFIGVGADVHMGLFDDDKYVSQAKAEFAQADDVKDETGELISHAQIVEITAMAQGAGVALQLICQAEKVDSLKDLLASRYEPIRKKLQIDLDKAAQQTRQAA